MKKEWPRDTWPAKPIRRLRPSAAMPKMMARLMITSHSLSPRNPKLRKPPSDPGASSPPKGRRIAAASNSPTIVLCVAVGSIACSESYAV